MGEDAVAGATGYRSGRLAFVRLLFLALVLGSWAAVPGFGAEPFQGTGQETAAPGANVRYKPQARPARLPAGAEIRIDGDLSDPGWALAAPLGDLTQVEPVQGVEPTLPMEVLLAYDRDFFYISWKCADDPNEVRARQRERDTFVRFDDVVEFWFDTFDSGRFGFWFQMTPAGSRGDALLADGGNSFNKAWDGIWYGRARVTDEGWQAEIAIPFKTLNFDEGAPVWGFNIKRERVANGEEDRWASPSLAYGFFNLTEGGELVGLSGMEQGYGIDLVPFVTLSHQNDEAVEGGEEDSDTLFQVGADLTWRATPSSTLRVTVNTDFAQAEADERRVNLTRFPLFFPERRPFFLEDVGLFEFGAPSRGNGGSKPVIPFFSRRIGLDSEGGEVPLIAGVKYTGRAGPWNFGILDTQVDGSIDAGPANLGVARITRNLGGLSSIGGIVTTGNPRSDDFASTAGLDLRIGSSRAFGPGHSGDIWAWWLNTQTDGPGGDGHAFGVEARTQTARWRHRAATFSVDDTFDPALGFVRRAGIRRYDLETEFTWRVRNDWVREVRFRASPSYTTNLSGDLDSWFVPIRWFDLEFASQDSLSFETRRIFERIPEPFTVGGDVEVSPGDFDQVRHVVRIESNDRRRIGSELRLEFGEFFSGDILRWRLTPVYIPGPLYTLSLSYDDIDVEIDEGEFHTQVVEARADFSFTPDLSWKNLVQYDTETFNLGIQSRLRWIIQPGQDLFLVAVAGWLRNEESSFIPTLQDFTMKFGYTLRF